MVGVSHRYSMHAAAGTCPATHCVTVCLTVSETAHPTPVGAPPEYVLEISLLSTSP